MDEPNKIIQQSCYINGKTCVNGKRDDFEINPITKERFTCNKWVSLKGKDPQTGDPIDHWMCNEFANVFLLTENSLFVRQNGAGIDKVANQINKQRAEFLNSLPDFVKEKLLELNPELVQNPNGQH
jgi:hypothetical protein